MIRIVRENCAGLREVFGKYQKLLKPGIHFYPFPFISRVVCISNKLLQESWSLEVKTKDHAIVKLPVVVKYRVEFEDSPTAYYTIDDPKEQMHASVAEVIRSEAPKFDLDELYLSTNEIANRVNVTLASKFKKYGYTISEVFFTNVIPDDTVVSSMNRINAARRAKVAAEAEAETELVKARAEAEAERIRKHLAGKGISEMREELYKGSTENIQSMADKLGISPSKVMDFIIQTMEVDMKIRLAESDNLKVLFLPDRPVSSLESLESKFQDTKITTEE